MAVIVIAAAALAALGVFSGDDKADKAATTTSKGAEPVARVLATIDVGDVPDGVATNKGTVFVTNAGDGTMSRIDALGERVLGEPLQVGTEPRGVVAGKGVVWVAARGDNKVVRFDANSDPPVAGRDDPGQVVTAGPVDRTAARVGGEHGRRHGQPHRPRLAHDPR